MVDLPAGRGIVNRKMSDENVNKETEEELEARVEGEETPEAAGDQEAEGNAVQMKLADAEAKAQEHWDQLLRSRAEMENLQRRAERDLANAHKFALEKFALELLPVRDSLELGLSAVAVSVGASLTAVSATVEAMLSTVLSSS